MKPQTNRQHVIKQENTPALLKLGRGQSYFIIFKSVTLRENSLEDKTQKKLQKE